MAPSSGSSPKCCQMKPGSGFRLMLNQPTSVKIYVALPLERTSAAEVSRTTTYLLPRIQRGTRSASSPSSPRRSGNWSPDSGWGRRERGSPWGRNPGAAGARRGGPSLQPARRTASSPEECPDLSPRRFWSGRSSATQGRRRWRPPGPGT